MKFKDLQVEDFPGLSLDPITFEDWKEAKDKERRYTIIFFVFILLFIAGLYLLTGDIFTPGLLVFLVIPWVISRKAKQLSKDLGITNRMYADAWKRRSQILKTGS